MDLGIREIQTDSGRSLQLSCAVPTTLPWFRGVDVGSVRCAND